MRRWFLVIMMTGVVHATPIKISLSYDPNISPETTAKIENNKRITLLWEIKPKVGTEVQRGELPPKELPKELELKLEPGWWDFNCACVDARAGALASANTLCVGRRSVNITDEPIKTGIVLGEPVLALILLDADRLDLPQKAVLTINDQAGNLICHQNLTINDRAMVISALTPKCTATFTVTCTREPAATDAVTCEMKPDQDHMINIELRPRAPAPGQDTNR